MNRAIPLLFSAGEREEGCRCPHCGEAIGRGQAIAVCRECGTVHHPQCWELAGTCGAYSCTPAQVQVSPNAPGVLKISAEEIHQVVPLPERRVPFPPLPLEPESPPTNGLAIAALVTAVAGIPFFGVLTGLVAIVLGCMALGSIRANHQGGAVLAGLGVLLGLADMVGWIIFLALVFSHPLAR